MIKPGAVLSAARSRSGLLDHLVRTYQRYQADTGDRLAAAVTFYWFLSLFPILLLVLAGYGYLHSGDSVEQLNDRLRGNLGGFLPTQLVDTLTETLSGAKGKAGLLGLGGLLLAGLGWIDALREAIRTIWHQNVKAGNFITRKLVDIVALVGLFATIAASAFVTGLAGSGPEWLLARLGVDQTTAAKVFLKVLGIALAALVDVVLFLYLFLRLARVPDAGAAGAQGRGVRRGRASASSSWSVASTSSTRPRRGGDLRDVRGGRRSAAVPQPGVPAGPVRVGLRGYRSWGR